MSQPELKVLRKPQISEIRAREVLDCRGLPTVQVDVVVDGTILGRADVPAGRSRGRHEPVELRDGGRRFGGFGVRQAVSNVRDVLAPALVGFPAVPQRQLDLGSSNWTAPRTGAAWAPTPCSACRWPPPAPRPRPRASRSTGT